MDRKLAENLTALTRGLKKTLIDLDGKIVEVPETVSIFNYLLRGFKIVKLNDEDPLKYLPGSYRFLFEDFKEQEKKKIKTDIKQETKTEK